MRFLASGKRRLGVMLALWAALAVVSALILVDAQRDGREELESRFELRAELTADFVDTYVADFIRQERAAAERVLGGPNPSQDTFSLVVAALESQEAVLLDSEGRAIHVAPEERALEGTDLASRYEHLESAVGGEATVSNIIPSAVEDILSVAFAIPFDSVDGTRVLGAAFDIRTTPLEPYLSNTAVIAPNEAYLVDGAGAVITASGEAGTESSKLPERLSGYASRSTTGELSEGGDYVVSQAIDGAPWQLIMTTPESFLYEPVSGGHRLVQWLVWLGFVAGGLLSIWLISRGVRRREKLAQLNVLLERQANVDPLTGVANRRKMADEIAREVKRARRDEEDLSVLVVDVDRFKSVNDACGSRIGDEVLRGISDALASIRDTDVLGRWGGDEFLIALPRANREGAAIVAERLIERVRTTPFLDDQDLIPVTLSIGCAQWEGEDAETLVLRADEALDAAKANGRDRYEIAPSRATGLVAQ